MFDMTVVGRTHTHIYTRTHTHARTRKLAPASPEKRGTCVVGRTLIRFQASESSGDEAVTIQAHTTQCGVCA
jgi:hypothetical protein